MVPCFSSCSDHIVVGTWISTLCFTYCLVDSFSLLFQSVQEMQEVLRQREATCFQHKTTLQPCMFKVASGDQQPTYYLSLNKIRYRFATCIKTLDISTKLHQVLDLQYMHQSSQAYTLIQKSCFGIDTVVDRVSPALSVLLEKCSKI